MGESVMMPAASADDWPVRVWVGYGLDSLVRPDRTAFYRTLGSVFIPATVQLMRPWGLTTYLPTVLNADSNPHVPDEVALVYYRSQDAYRRACTCSVGGRAYVRLHQTAFRFTPQHGITGSHSGFPSRFTTDAPLPAQGYLHLFDQPVDWNAGNAQVQVAIYEGNQGDRFRNDLCRRLREIEHAPENGLDGVILALSGPLVVCWSHWQNSVSADDLLADIDGLRTVANVAARLITVPASPLISFEGIEIDGGVGFRVMPQDEKDIASIEVAAAMQ